MKEVVAAFSQEKVLVGAFSVIVKTGRQELGELEAGMQMSRCGPCPAAVFYPPAARHRDPVMIRVQGDNELATALSKYFSASITNYPLIDCPSCSISCGG